MSNVHYKHLQVLIRWAAILLVVLVVLWLVKMDLALSGQFSVSHDYQSPSAFFTELVPKQRIATKSEGVEFLDEPVYSTFRYPRPFQEMTAMVHFSNPNDLYAEFGPQVGLPEVYELQGLNDPQINQLLSSEDWLSVGQEMYQKKTADYHYLSLSQFWSGMPDQQTVGYYGVDWQQPYLPEFEEEQEGFELLTPLRGSHSFFAAAPAGEFTIEFVVQDINLLENPDPIELVLSDWNSQELERVMTEDDGVISADGGVTSSRRISAVVEVSEASVLAIRLGANDDIIIHSIKTNTPYFVANRRVHLAGGPDYISEFGDDKLQSVELRLSARRWSAQTLHRSTIQDLRLVHETVRLQEPYKNYAYAVPRERRFLLSDGYPMYTELGNIVIEGRGVMSFTPESFFTPYPWFIDSSVDASVLGLNYLITGYQPPFEMADGSFMQTYTFDLSKVFAPSKALRFQWSLPELEDANGFLLHSVNAEYESEPVTLSNFTEKAKRFLKREFGYGE